MRRSLLRSAPLAFAVALAACGGAPAGSSDGSRAAGSGAPDDPIATLVDHVAPLTTQCTFVSSTVTVTVDPGETAIVTKRAADSAILVNGEVCNNGAAGGRGVAPAVTVTSSMMKKLTIGQSSAGAQTVMLDFGNGVFGLSNGTPSTGIVVDLGNDSGDQLAIQATPNADTVSIGSAGISINDSAHLGITLGNPIEAITFVLGDGNDSFTSGGDTLAGGVGNGVFVPSGTLTVNGGNGNDTFLQGKVPTPGEKLFGGAGTDTLSYAARTAGVLVSVGIGASGNDGDPAYGGGAGELDDVQADIEVVLGGAGSDTLSSALATCAVATGCITLNGGPGDDWFDQGTSASHGEVLIGGAGIDTVDYGGRANALVVTMDGLKMDDGESLAAETDNVSADVEQLFGGAGNDSLTGNLRANTISGGAGNDTIHGLDGDDVFYMVAWDHANGAWLAGADGADLVFGDNGNDRADYSGRSGGVTATLHDGTTADAFRGDSGAAGENDDLRVENLQGSGTADCVLTGNSSSNELVGGQGSDVLDGGAGDDYLDGGGSTGADTLVCGAGFDVTLDVGSGGGTKGADCEL